MASDLLLDPHIRLWVFFPIVLITFVIGLLKHYVTLIMHTEKTSSLQQVSDQHYLTRSALIRENGKYLPSASIRLRKAHLIDKEIGYFYTEEREAKNANPMTDPTMMNDMMKGNLVHMMSMMLVGGYINFAFSGFLTTKVPFPLTFRFKSMLQRGIDLPSLDASWVSSVSWYFLNYFGLSKLYSLVLGQSNKAAEMDRMMMDPLNTQASQGQQLDSKAMFKAEREALEVAKHKFIL